MSFAPALHHGEIVSRRIEALVNLVDESRCIGLAGPSISDIADVLKCTRSQAIHVKTQAIALGRLRVGPRGLEIAG